MADVSRDAFLSNLEDGVRADIVTVARKLREAAADIERVAENENLSTQRKVARTIHEVNWALANLNLDGLVNKLDDLASLKESS